jgi:hypothetical protein
MVTGRSLPTGSLVKHSGATHGGGAILGGHHQVVQQFKNNNTLLT